MGSNGKRDTDIKRPVRWLPSAWARIQEAAEMLTLRDHVKMSAADVIRTGTLRYVDEVLGPPTDMPHETPPVNNPHHQERTRWPEPQPR